MQRGEVWWARFEEQHPVVLLSSSLDCGTHDEIGVRAVQIVAAAGIDVSSEEILDRVGTWVTTLGADDLVECIGALSPAKLAEIDEALALADRTVSAADAEHDEAVSTLVTIRQSLRQGTMVTRQIKRV